MRLAFVCMIVVLACGPTPGPKYPQPVELSTTQGVVDRLAQIRDSRKSFRAESVMDYWLGGQRLKGTVYVMGTDKRQVRFNAISPQQDVLADMACDGTNFAMVNMQKNCQLTGPCNKRSIAVFLNVELEPEDVLHMALGTVPVNAQATGTVQWDATKGQETVRLESPDGTQTIVIDGRDGRWDVLSSELVGRDGKVMWSVENAEFQAVKEPNGNTHRLPGKTRFKAPGQKADLLVEWKSNERAVNLEIDPAKFKVEVPTGLALCP